MFEIYRRFDNEQTNPQPAAGSIGRQNSLQRPSKAPAPPVQNQVKPRQENIPRPKQQSAKVPERQGVSSSSVRTGQQSVDSEKKSGPTNAQKKNTSKGMGFLHGFLPPSLYDPSSKKLFGFLSSEDLLLIALIFLLLEKDGDDNLLIILALLYVLISDYIELPELGF